MARKPNQTDVTTAAHDQVYRRLRSRIMYGDILPAQAQARDYGQRGALFPIVERDLLEQAIREAIDHDELRLFFQPSVSARS